MGMISGILCLICFCMLSAKAAAAKLNRTKLDKVLMRIHKPASAFLLFMWIVHMILIVPVWRNRALPVLVSGIAGAVLMLLLIFLCHAIKDRRERIRWHRILTICMAAGLMAHVVTYFIDFNNYKKNIANLEIHDAELGNVKDGLYRGECDVGYIYARVEVEVRDGRIVSVNLLEHQNERGKRAEELTAKVVSEQRIDVDAVSGATNSSKVIKKAIEKAIFSQSP